MTGKDLRKIRDTLGWTQRQLAEAVGLDVNTIARQERGELGIREPMARLVRRILAEQKGQRRGK